MPRTTKEDYARHYRDYQGTPEQIKKRAQRNAARAEAEEKYGKAALRGKDVHHVRPIRSGGGNKGNTVLRSRSKNRGDTR